MNRVNEFIFNVKNYANETELYKALTNFIHQLIDNKCIMTIEEDEGDILVRYSSLEYEMEEPLPYFLYKDEYNFATIYHNSKEIALCDNIINEASKQLERAQQDFKKIGIDLGNDPLDTDDILKHDDEDKGGNNLC